MQTVYTTGAFDVLHKGHINILTEAKKLGRLIVGIQDDEGLLLSKGRYPTLNTQERKEQLESLPFVDEVIVYHDLNQIPVYEKIKPNILVQGDDWYKTADRSEVVPYLEQNGIQVVLLPTTEGISSSMIKKRVLSQNERKDREFILKHIELASISDLKLYEHFSEQKVGRLMSKIWGEKVFFNPITVTEQNIVIDGVNRLEALRRLGLKFVPIMRVDYEKDVELSANVHFKHNGKLTRLSEFGESEGERIDFKKYEKSDIIKMVENGEMIDSGITWHKVNYAVVRLRVPLSQLFAGFDMKEYLQRSINESHIRYYPSNIYICDEWW